MGVHSAIHGALCDHLDLFTKTSHDFVAWEGMHATPQDNALYLRAYVLPAPPKVVTLGVSGLQEINGIFQIDVVSPGGIGWGPAKSKVDGLCTHFARGTMLTSGGYTVRLLRAWPGPATVDVVAGWKTPTKSYCIPVSIHWLAYFVGG